MTTFELILVLLVTFISSSLIKGWTGFGTNLIAMPFLATFLGYTLTDSVTIVISINIFMNIAILIENKNLDLSYLKNIGWIVVFGVTFTFLGSYFLKNPNNATYLKIVSGSIIVLTGIYQVLKMRFNFKTLFYQETMSKYFIPVGIISGIFNGIAGLGGLPVLILLSNSDMDRETFRKTLVSYFTVMNIVAMIGFLVSGNYTTFVLQHIGGLVTPSVIACMVGVYISKRVTDKVFRKVVIGVLIFMELNLFVNGIWGINIISFFINMV